MVVFACRLGGGIIGMSHCKREPAHLLLRQSDNTLRVINLATRQVRTQHDIRLRIGQGIG